MFSKLKNKAQDKSEDIIEEHIPKIKSLLKEEIGIEAKDAFENDELMTKALSRVYDLLILLHPTIRFFIKRERLISFGLSNRNRLIDWRDTRSLPPPTPQQSGEAKTQNTERENEMSEQKSRAEQLFGQGLMTYLTGEDTASKQKAIELLTEALKSELPHPKNIFCHMHIGNITLVLARGSKEIDVLSEQDISTLPMLGEALRKLERALSLDAQSGERNLGDRLRQALILQPLDFLWMSQSIYIKKHQGPDSELSYLQDKLKKIEYLNTSLPGLCLSFSYHYGEANNKPLAVEWLHRAVNADIYSDVEETRTLTYFKIAQGYKNQAQQMLQSLSPYPDAQEGERLIAKQRAAGECEICGTKLGFFEKAGGNVRCKAHR